MFTSDPRSSGSKRRATLRGLLTLHNLTTYSSDFSFFSSFFLTSSKIPIKEGSPLFFLPPLPSLSFA